MNTKRINEELQCLLFSSADISKDTFDWRLWCRLCANEDKKGNISIFLKNDRESREKSTPATDGEATFCMATAIKQYFQVNVSHEEQMSKMLCANCFSLVTSLVDFTNRVSKVQQMFKALANSNTNTHSDLHSLRLKFGFWNKNVETEYVQIKLPKLKTTPNKWEENINKADTTAMNMIQIPINEIKIEKETIFDYNVQAMGYKEKVDNVIKELEVHKDMENKLERKIITTDITTMDIIEKPVKKIKIEEESISQYDVQMIGGNKMVNNAIEKLVVCRDMKNEQYSCNGVDVSKKEDMEFLWNSDDSNDIDLPLSEKQQCHTENTSQDNIPENVACIDKSVQHSSLTNNLTKPELRCTKCPRAFIDSFQLKRHEQVHLPMVISCPYCDDKFTIARNMEAHIKIVHMQERPLNCEECGFSTNTKQNFERHKWTQYAAPYNCEMCKLRFKTEVQYKVAEQLSTPYASSSPGTSRTRVSSTSNRTGLKRRQCQVGFCNKNKTKQTCSICNRYMCGHCESELKKCQECEHL